MYKSFIRPAIVCIFLVTLSTYPTYSQLFFTNGYIVLASGDTVKGEIRERNVQLINFRPNQSATILDYVPNQLIGYYSDGINHLTVDLTEDGRTSAYFMQEQTKGYVSLYRLFKPEGNLSHALRLPDKRFIPLRGNLSLLMLSNNLTECQSPAFKQMFNVHNFYPSSYKFEQIIKAYNTCVNPTQSIQKPKKVFRYEAGLSLGAAINGWVYGAADKQNSVYYNPYVSYSPTYAVAGGGFFTVAPQKRLSAGLEILASWYKGSRSIPLTDPLNPSNVDSRLYSFSETYFALPLTGRYIFADHAIRWYLKAGLVPTLSTNVSGKYSGSSLNLDADITILNRTNIGIGYLAGIGAVIPIAKKRHINIECRTMPHFVLDGVTRTATSRSLQLMVHIPLIKNVKQ